MATREEMIAFIKSKQQSPQASQVNQAAPNREQMIQFIKQKQAEKLNSPSPKEQEYDYSNLGQVASDLGQQIVKGAKQAPEAIASTIGFNVAGPVGSGIGSVIGKSASEAAQGIAQAVKDPQAFLKDLARLPTKEQVIQQVNDYLTTFGVNVAAPAVVSKVASSMSKAPQGIKQQAEDLAEKATGATAVQAEKFKKGAGRELLDRGVVKFGETPKKIAERSQQLIEKTYKDIDDVLTTLDEKGAQVNVSEVLDNIQKQADKLAKDPAQASVVKKLNSISEDIVNSGDSFVKPSQAEQTKRGFNKIAKNWLDPETGEAGKIAYRAYRDAVEKVAKETEPSLLKKFKEAKETYGLMNPIQEAAERRAQQQKQSPLGQFIDIVTVGGGGAAVGGVEGLATGLGLAAARRYVSPRLASSGAVTLNNVSKILEKSPEFSKLLRDNPAQFSALTKSVYDSFNEKPKEKVESKKEFPKVVRKNGQRAIVKNQSELDEARLEGWK